MITYGTAGRPARALAALMLLVGLVPGASVGAQDRMPPIPADKMTEPQKKAVAD